MNKRILVQDWSGKLGKKYKVLKNIKANFINPEANFFKKGEIICDWDIDYFFSGNTKEFFIGDNWIEPINESKKEHS